MEAQVVSIRELYELLDRRARELGYVDCDELVEWLRLVRDVPYIEADEVVASWANGEL